MKPRNIHYVIKQCLEVIPDRYLTVKDELKEIEYHAKFTAPEAMWDRWNELCLCLQRSMPNPNKPRCPKWAVKLNNIVCNKE